MSLSVHEPPTASLKTKHRIPGYGTHNSRRPASDEKWIPTVCTMCYNACSIQVLVRDGVATAIEGLPDAPPNFGKMCAKGKAALSELYGTSRVLTPLKRTNPEKGIGVDPRWQEITWEEAMDTIVGKIRRAMEPGAGGVSTMTFDGPASTAVDGAFHVACGGTKGATVPSGVNLFCGRAVHPVAFMVNGSSDKQPDFTYTKYMIVFGGGFGTGTGTHAMTFARDLAEAHVKRGLKMVVVDPCQTSSGARADEWIPIVPGTDSALCLAMANLLVNEYGMYDADFLRSYTNAPYLIRPNGLYARDSTGGKPLVLSKSKGVPVSYDVADPKDIALEGEANVGGERAQTAFVLLREHLKKYTPEFASEVTTIPVSTIKRIAREFGTAASIGATTDIDGVRLPLRPACAMWYRGLGQHQHGLQNGWAAAMLNIVVGAVDVPGGYCGTETTGPWGLPEAGQDGIIKTTNPFRGGARFSAPPKPAQFDPDDPSLSRMFPVTVVTSVMGGITLKDPEKFGMKVRPDVWICSRGNPMKSTGDPEEVARLLKKIPFQISFVQHHEETSEFADIVLPDTHYLERSAPFTGDPYRIFMHAPTTYDRDWHFAMQQQVVKPMGQAKNWFDVLWDVAHRLGVADEFYSALNANLRLKPENRLQRGKLYTREEFADRWMRDWCGEEHGLEYFKKHGWATSSQERQVKDRYPRLFHKGRIPLYLEHWLTAGESVRAVVAERGLDWGDLSDYEAMVNYKPCGASKEGGEDYPLYLVSPKVGFLTINTSTIKNPHLQEIAWAMGEIFNTGIHPKTALALGVSNGDPIEIEAANGRKVRSVARITSAVHPNVISAPGNASKVLSPDEKHEMGEGVHLNSFIPFEIKRIDMVSGALDACMKVRVRSVSAEGFDSRRRKMQG